VSGRRVAVIAGTEVAALHGVSGRFSWGEGRTFTPGECDGLSAWAPGAVIALRESPPPGPWASIAWGVAGDRHVGIDGGWRLAPLPASDALVALRARSGSVLVVTGGNEAARASAIEKLRSRRVEARAVPTLTIGELEDAAVVAVVGATDSPLPDVAPAVLAAGRILVAPRAKPSFGFVPWSDHLPYENEDEMVCAADMAYTYLEAFGVIADMGSLAAEAHLASRVYGRLAIDAELELLGDARGGAVEYPPADDERCDDQRGGNE
jgi:hypothetical protein